MKTIIVDYNGDGKKIGTYLTSVFPSLNINAVYKALRKKDIKLNGKRINTNEIVHFNDELTLYITDDILNGSSQEVQISTIYEDDNIVIFNKPTQLEVVGENSLTSIMKKNYEFLEPCHRIDRNTMGLVLYAKNEFSHKFLLDKFKSFEIEKHYIACCYGKAKQLANLNAYLFKDSKKSIVYISDEPKSHFVKIKTSYKLINYNTASNLSLLDVTLHTGRTHQIRAHLAHCGLPILGDGKYGSYEINRRFKVYSQMLCSYSIGFNFTSCPDDFKYLTGLCISLKKIPYTEFFK